MRSLQIIAGATALLTGLYFWNTSPRRRVKIAERKAQQSAQRQEALTPEAREIYASAVAGTSVFADAGEQTGELVIANGDRGEGPPRDDLPLAARLPRALMGPIAQSPADLTTSEPLVVAEPPKRGDRPRARPNPRPSPRRSRAAVRNRDGLAGDAIVENND